MRAESNTLITLLSHKHSSLSWRFVLVGIKFISSSFLSLIILFNPVSSSFISSILSFVYIPLNSFTLYFFCNALFAVFSVFFPFNTNRIISSSNFKFFFLRSASKRASSISFSLSVKKAPVSTE